MGREVVSAPGEALLHETNSGQELKRIFEIFQCTERVLGALEGATQHLAG